MAVSQNISLEPYLTVSDETMKASYGGSQTWFSKEMNLSWDRYRNIGGCGLVANCDFILYYCKKNRLRFPDMPKSFIDSDYQYIDKREYMDFLRKTSRLKYPILPYLGSFSFQAPPFVNLFMRQMKQEKRLHFLWKDTAKERMKVIRTSLQEGYPVILVIGPHFLTFWQRNGVKFYRMNQEEEVTVDQKSIMKHFVMITGLYYPEDASKSVLLEISSWGRKLYIDFEELDTYIRKCSNPWLCGFYYLK